jgi:AmmeMemoRadiSam system protein B
MQLRKPAVAGSFYPAQPDRLRREVVELLADARTALKITPKALIVPHAGYIYSGRVAALAFATLFDSAFARIVLIGPAHYVAIRGVAFPAIDAFETPLGHVPVDHDGLNEIKDLPFVSRNEEAHAPEHALEVELPFLQIVVPSFSLLPLVTPPRTRSRRCWRDCGAARKHCPLSAPTCPTITVTRPPGAWMRQLLRLSRMVTGPVWAQDKRAATSRWLAFL